MPKNWKSTRTREDRYNITGITDHILRHAKNSPETMCVIDVGCSEGIAMSGARACLQKHRVNVYAIGIDLSSEVATLAKTNMDKFIKADVLEVDCHEKADVVICANVVRYVDGERKHKVLTKCAQLLKADGVLIVAAGTYKKFPKNSDNSSRSCYPSKKGLLSRVCARIERFTVRDVLCLNKGEALSFAEHALEDWNSRSRLEWTVSYFKWRCILSLDNLMRGRVLSV